MYFVIICIDKKYIYLFIPLAANYSISYNSNSICLTVKYRKRNRRNDSISRTIIIIKGALPCRTKYTRMCVDTLSYVHSTELSIAMTQPDLRTSYWPTNVNTRMSTPLVSLHHGVQEISLPIRPPAPIYAYSCRLPRSRRHPQLHPFTTDAVVSHHIPSTITAPLHSTPHPPNHTNTTIPRPIHTVCRNSPPYITHTHTHVIPTHTYFFALRYTSSFLPTMNLKTVITIIITYLHIRISIDWLIDEFNYCILICAVHFRNYIRW